MYDYLRQLGDRLSTEQLIEVFGNIAALDKTAICKDWAELLGAVGPVEMLKLAQLFGGREFKIPPLYQVLTVYAALMVNEVAKTQPYELAKKQVLGELVLDGFDELAEQLRTLTKTDSEVQREDDLGIL